MNIRWWQGGIHIDPGLLSDDENEKETYSESLRLLHHVFTFLVDVSEGRIKIIMPPDYHRDRDPSKHYPSDDARKYHLGLNS